MDSEAHGWTMAVLYTVFENYENVMQFYEGEEGARRLAREYGHGLAFCADGEDYIKASYSCLAVQVYNFCPPIDAGDWNREVLCAWRWSDEKQRGVE